MGSDINYWWHNRKKRMVTKKGIIIGSLVGVVIVVVTLASIYYFKRAEELNTYSNSSLISEFKTLSDFQSIKSDYFNKTLNVDFDLEFDQNLKLKDQYITLDTFREKYLAFIQKKGYWKNVKKEDIKVKVTYSAFQNAELTNTVLTDTSDNQFNGSKWSKKVYSIKYLSSLEQAQTVNDTAGTDTSVFDTSEEGSSSDTSGSSTDTSTTSPVLTDNGDVWVTLTHQQKLDLVHTAISNIESHGGISDVSDDWYVKALDAMYGDSATNSVQIAKAIAMTGVAGKVLHK